MGLWPRDHSKGGEPISRENAQETVSSIQAKANRAQASGDHDRARFLRSGADAELDTLNDINRLEAHGFRRPKR
ncbi:hypothetical protein ABT052_17880 [Streptomyces sp. NPDC002766]|uniref:hypothetical protein n=1 Tax=Streptomyces sp. NPDC002766 TaxID=3154429 RepID=UPI00332406A4